MALPVTLKDIVEGLEFQSDEGASYLNTATGDVVYVTQEELRAAEEDAPLADSQPGSTTRSASPKTSWKRTFTALPGFAAFCC